MSILNEFREAVEIQQRKDDEAYEEQMRLPVAERVAKGITMTNLRVIFDFHDYAPNQWCPILEAPEKFIKSAKIICQNNISKFREGTTVVLSNYGNVFKMEIEEDSIDNFVLKPNDFDVKECYINSKNYNQNNWEINIVKSNVTRRLLLATANNLEYDIERLEKIENLFKGSLPNPNISYNGFNSLNHSQNVAVQKAFNKQNFHLIQGPPGTGKTEAIGHLAKLLIDSGKNVFVTGPTHTAINNCLNAISSKVRDKSKVVKIGEKHQAAEILKNDFITRKTRLPINSYTYNDDLSHEGIIIGGTPYSLCYPASKRLNEWEFDIALIDEAAQMSIPLSISVMSKSHKFIFVGDHMQLDPIVPSGTSNSMFSESVFRRLVRLYPGEVTLLNISYRLNDGLIRIPNTLFYQNQLISDDSLNVPPLYLSSSKYPEVLNHKDGHILYLHQEFDAQGRSPYEANIVSELVEDLLLNGIKLKDIGIISPYRAQVREIKKAIDKKIGITNPEFNDELFIDTVDRMQGQEKDYIIYSLSNSHPLESKRRLDFFYSPNRLNVAITRAIKRCIVISNYKVFDIIDDEISDLEEFDILKPSLDIFKNYYSLSSKVEINDIVDEW